jgi:hypothetical protein
VEAWKPGRPQKPGFLLFYFAKGNPVILSSDQEGLSSNVFLLQREVTAGSGRAAKY